MKKDKIKILLEYIPFIILIISAIMLLWTVTTTDITLVWKHVAGLCALPTIIIAFWWRHKIGILTLGLTIILGLLGILTYSPIMTTVTWTIGKTSDSQIPVFYGQPIFLLWLIMHFILSGRHYVGILTKKYWQDINAK